MRSDLPQVVLGASWCSLPLFSNKCTYVLMFQIELFNLYMLFIVKLCFLQLTLQLSLLSPCMNIICIIVPCDLLSTFKVLMALSPVLKQRSKMNKCRDAQTSSRRSSLMTRLPGTSSTRQPVGLQGGFVRSLVFLCKVLLCQFL